MVSDFTWITMVIVGMIAIVVSMFMLSAYKEARKKENGDKKE